MNRNDVERGRCWLDENNANEKVHPACHVCPSLEEDFCEMEGKNHGEKEATAAATAPSNWSNDNESSPDANGLICSASAGSVHSMLESVSDLSRQKLSHTTTPAQPAISHVTPTTTSTTDINVSSEYKPPSQAVIVQPKKSIMRKGSSNGDLDDKGSIIPIRYDRWAWKALPAPTGRTPTRGRKPLRRPRSSAVPTREMAIKTLTRVNSLPSLESPTCSSPRSSEEKEECEHSEGGGYCGPARRRRVFFSKIDMREYDIDLGDNPSCVKGPPITLDWSWRQPMPAMPLDLYEYRRWGATSLGGMPPMKTQKELHLPPDIRRQRLAAANDISHRDMDRATEHVERIRRQRTFTKDYMLPWMGVEHVVQTAHRMARKVFHLGKKVPASEAWEPSPQDPALVWRLKTDRNRAA